MFRREDSWPPPIDDPESRGGRPRRRARREVRPAQADLRHGPAQPREQRAHPRLREAGRPLGRRHVHQRAAHGRVPGGRGSGPVAALLLHRGEHAASCWRTRATCGPSCPTRPGVKNYYDVAPGSGTEVKGHFIKVPEGHRHGPNADGSEIRAEDKGYPQPPNNGSWQTDLRLPDSGRHRRPAVGARVLERHQQRLPVRARRGHRLRQAPRHAGTSSTSSTPAAVGRAAQSLDTPNFRSTNGRVWRMVLDQKDPTKVTSLTVLVEGDDNPVKTPTEVHQPDNLESTQTGLLITEDPGSSQQFPVGSTDPNATTARLWYVPFSGTPEVVRRRSTSRPTAARPTSTAGRPATGARGRRPASSTRPRRSVAAPSSSTSRRTRSGSSRRRVTTTTATATPTSRTSERAASSR